MNSIHEVNKWETFMLNIGKNLTSLILGIGMDNNHYAALFDALVKVTPPLQEIDYYGEEKGYQLSNFLYQLMANIPSLNDGGEEEIFDLNSQFCKSKVKDLFLNRIDFNNTDNTDKQEVENIFNTSSQNLNSIRVAKSHIDGKGFFILLQTLINFKKQDKIKSFPRLIIKNNKGIITHHNLSEYLNDEENMRTISKLNVADSYSENTMNNILNTTEIS